MNYIKEDDFDFYTELNDMPTIEQGQEQQTLDYKCLISHLPLTYNAITLTCNHSFNYLPLFKELCLTHHKYILYCPYCRTVSAKLMPYIPLPGVTKIHGINSPNSKCMPAPACSVITKKGTSCGLDGIACTEGIFCAKHLPKKEAELTYEMEALSNSKNIPELKRMLREKGLKVGGNKFDLVKRLLTK